MRKSAYTLFLCFIFANMALAAPFDLNFTSMVSEVRSIPSVNVGDSFEITFTVDNGGNTTINQIWQFADIQSVNFSVNSGAYTVNLPRASFLFTQDEGSIKTDGTGAVSSVPVLWIAQITDNNLDSNGNQLSFWFLSEQGVIVAAASGDVYIDAIDDFSDGSRWTILGNAPTPSPATAKAVPTMSVYGLIFTAFGVLLVATRRLRNVAWKR